jgi:hypothetical protein
MDWFDKINPKVKIENRLGKIISDKIGIAFNDFYSDLKKHMESVKNEVHYAFQRDHDLLGRILKCHLILETYLDKCLKHFNKDQLSIDNTSLRFIQKIDLLENKLDELKTYFKGIRSLNTIRNKLAHNLHAEITLSDVQNMRIYVEVYRTRKIDDPIKIIEDFTLIACALLENATSEKFGDFSMIFAAGVKALESNPEEYKKYFENNK